MIKVESVTFQYPGSAPVLQNFTWQVRRGESWSVLGASGSGKTTLLHLLAGLKTCRQGRIEIDAKTLIRPRPETGLILQGHGLLPWATIEKNIGLGLRIRRFYGNDGKHTPKHFFMSRKEEKNQIQFWMEKMGITGLGSRYPGEISGGEQQRAAIARTLILAPDLLLMDEPFGALDVSTRNTLQDLVLDLNKEKTYTRILVTHNIDEALKMGEKILVFTKSGQAHQIIDNSFPESGNTDLSDTICRILGKGHESEN